MILFFDNLITDIPLYPGIYTDLDRVRDSAYSYRFQSRIDVTKYTLASYAEVDWTYVVTKYELDPFDEKEKRELDKFIKEIFPSAIILYGRSDTSKKFKKTIEEYINPCSDDLIFYAGNNDHPILLPDMDIF